MPRKREGPAKMSGMGMRGEKVAKDLESNSQGRRSGQQASGVSGKHIHRKTPSIPTVLQRAESESAQGPGKDQGKAKAQREGGSRRRAWSPHLWELVTWEGALTQLRECRKVSHQILAHHYSQEGKPMVVDGGRSLLKLSDLNKQANKTKQRTHKSVLRQRKQKPLHKRELLFCMLFGRARVCIV